MNILESATSVRRLLLGLLASALLLACNGIQGKVEKRGNLFFLVNTSTSVRYRFTVKETEVQDGKVYRYATQFHELEPGEEVHIGKIASFIPAMHPLKQRQVIRFENIPTKEELIAKEKGQKTPRGGLRENDPFASREERMKSKSEGEAYTPQGASIFKISSYAKDTIINGASMKYYFTTEDYYDKAVTIPSKSYQYKYEVKGQVEIKE